MCRRRGIVGYNNLCSVTAKCGPELVGPKVGREYLFRGLLLDQS